MPLDRISKYERAIPILVRQIILIVKRFLLNAAVFHLFAFLFGSVEFIGLFMDPNGPNAGMAEEIVAEADMGSVEDSHEERDGPNFHQLRHELKMCAEAKGDCSRLAQDSLERAEALINEVHYRESLPDQGPAWQDRTEDLIAEAEHEVDDVESDMEMARELDQDTAEAKKIYNAELDAEYRRLREREKALLTENARIRALLNGS
jgi:hypothetical protein